MTKIQGKIIKFLGRYDYIDIYAYLCDIGSYLYALSNFLNKICI